MNDWFQHHGRKGQQWGVSNGPPYPLNKKGLSYYISKHKTTKEDQKRIKEEEEAKKKQAEDEELERNKENILRSGKASDVLKYKGKLSNQELQSVVTRLNLERSLNEYSSKEKQSSIKKMDEIMITIDKAVKWTNTGIKLYNTAAGMYNSLSDNPKKLRTINIKSGEDKKKKK